MFQTASKIITFEEFLDWYPDGYGRYELYDGAIVEMQPTGTHEQVSGFTASKLAIEIDRLSMDCFIPRQAFIKLSDSNKSGYIPDVIVLNQTGLELEPMWKKRSTITKGETVRLIIEVVSTNWQDDYLTKLRDYEALQIPEYWIIDYLGLGGRRYIGFPKQPTLTIYRLVDGEYEVQQFRGSDRLISIAFPQLNLTTEQIFNSANLGI
ncbi:Uma2 family endonuclease [Pseudanabaena sp. Chao 1811]|uniref:Uma2 family endonuclease n=1 Tax=Pseudanabaena sp. Chao 1811 TaxID=2963092 RepID=UPI0022F386F9|nr:Uma2 family endonuclease [Pseudanabaena sp. Chao 1811]